MTKSCTCHQTPTPSYSQIGKPKESSVIGEILALAARPEVISFAGGLPSAEGFRSRPSRMRPIGFWRRVRRWLCSTPPWAACPHFSKPSPKSRPTTACPRRPTKS
ncbi:MAG: hypothetical protein ACLUNV_11975 [Sutterella wadsworthensis]